MKIRFFLTTNMQIEWTVPDEQVANFSLVGLVNGVRACGYFLQPNLYIPADCIVSIGVDKGGTAPFVMSEIPPGMTRQ